MFTYTECLKNYREEYGSGICLIEYISQHDQQNRKARSYNENANRNMEDIEHNCEIALEIEEAKEEEYNKYKTYLDLDKTIVYVKNENELSKLVRESDDLVYISNEQFKYVCDMGAAILMGGAGSGKTLVCLHKLSNYKGYMCNKWIRNFSISFKEISETSRKVLEGKYKYIKEYGNDGRQIICEDTSEIRKKEIIARLNEDDEILDKDKKVIFEDLKKIYKICTTFEYRKVEESLDKRILSLEEYLSLGKEVSIYSEDERKIIYAIAVNYQQYLDSNNLYDDNDLAGLSIVKLKEESKIPFQFLVIDEVQDLTEIQIYLIYNLVECKDNIFFAGDIHQIINGRALSEECLDWNGRLDYSKIDNLLYFSDGEKYGYRYMRKEE